MKEMIKVTRWDIVLANFEGNVGSEQGGHRYCLVIQNDKGNTYSTTTIVVPMTTKHKKAYLPTHVELNKEHHSKIQESVLLTEQIRTIDKVRIIRNLGRLENKDKKYKEIQKAIKISLGF